MNDLLAWAADHPEATVALAVLLLTLVERAIRRAAPRAADVVAAAIPHVPSIVDALKGRGPSSMRPPPDDKPKAPPGIATMGLLCMALAFAGCLGLGCGGAAQFEELAHASRDVATVAEPCLVAAKDHEESRCNGDEACVAAVKAKWRPIADALDMMRDAWCSLSPDAEGCR